MLGTIDPLVHVIAAFVVGGMAHVAILTLCRRTARYVSVARGAGSRGMEPGIFGRNLWMHAVAAVGAASFLLAFLNFYVYVGFGAQLDIYRRGVSDRPWVALTFDDGPSPDYTPRILDILKEHNVPATFFMVGAHVEAYPEIARRVVEEGHEVGNHTWSHLNVPTASTPRLYDEMIRTTWTIADVTGAYPQFVRPPRGLYDGRFGRMANVLGQRMVLWTLSSRDWRYGTTAQAITARIASRVRPGDILLFHDSGALIRREGGDRQATVGSLPAVIEAVRAKGLEFVPLSVLLEGATGEPNPVAPDQE